MIFNKLLAISLMATISLFSGNLQTPSKELGKDPQVFVDKSRDQQALHDAELELETLFRFKYSINDVDHDKFFNKCYMLMEQGKPQAGIKFFEKLSIYFPDSPMYHYGISFAFLNHTEDAKKVTGMNKEELFKSGYRHAQEAYKKDPNNKLFLTNLTFYYEVAYMEFAGYVDWDGLLKILDEQEPKLKETDIDSKAEFEMLRAMVYLVYEDKPKVEEHIKKCEQLDKNNFKGAIKKLKKDLKKVK